jgi:hypothetical protein
MLSLGFALFEGCNLGFALTEQRFGRSVIFEETCVR